MEMLLMSSSHQALTQVLQAPVWSNSNVALTQDLNPITWTRKCSGRVRILNSNKVKMNVTGNSTHSLCSIQSENVLSNLKAWSKHSWVEKRCVLVRLTHTAGPKLQSILSQMTTEGQTGRERGEIRNRCEGFTSRPSLYNQTPLLCSNQREEQIKQIKERGGEGPFFLSLLDPFANLTEMTEAGKIFFKVTWNRILCW